MKVKDVVVSGSLRCFTSELAVSLGINAALVFERLRYLFEFEGNGKWLNGHRWLFNSYPQWRSGHFPWMCERNVRYAFKLLEDRGMVVSIQPDGPSRRKYYRISDGAMEVELSHPAESAGCIRQNLPLPLTCIDSTDKDVREESSAPLASSENTMDIKSHRKPSLPLKTPSAPAKPEPPSASAPPREKVEAFIEEFCPKITDHRPDIWETQDWSKVNNWKTYLAGLEAKMQRATEKHIH